MTVLLDTNVLSEPMRERPDAVVMAELEQGDHSLQTASLVIHELSYGIQRLANGRRKQRFRIYQQNLRPQDHAPTRLVLTPCPP